jgi:predicted KAP-like P-loop ATPase
MNLYSSDKPVQDKDQDRFQRYGFSKRIAETIIQRNQDDGVVIGIYGAWGEGKTSVLNFIKNELDNHENINTISLNPWRYNDEDSLIKNFLKKIADVLGKEIESKKEKLGAFVEKYGTIGTIIGKDVSEIGKNLGAVELEILKSRIDEFLNESESKLVIFVDDIDRLDKQEIYSLFRLVKLTADFTKTTYILSFDEKMVASAIGKRFGGGNKKSGKNFLEKIIQVPLQIPRAQPEDLQQYCFDLINNAISENKIDLKENEAQRFAPEFSRNILLRLNTPRLAVRYGNSLSFAFPLLNGEVNLGDLMLIEALKVFYPKHYEFVKHNSSYFLSSYDSHYGNILENKEAKKKELEEHLEKLGKSLTSRERKAALNLLKELFPRLKEAFENSFHHNGPLEWYKAKRIVSPEYFNRYFSYCVLKGEISDVSFDSFIATAKEKQADEIKQSLKDLIKSSSAKNFLHKIRSLEEDLDWETSKKIGIVIGLSGELFPEDNSVFNFGFDRTNSQAAIFVYHLIKNHNNKEEKLELAIEILKTAQPFDFAQNINYWFRSGESEEDKIFTLEEYNKLAIVSINRALQEAADEPIFEKFHEATWYILESWHELKKQEFDEYIKNILNKNPLKVLSLLESFTPEMRSSNHPAPYKANFKKVHFDRFKQTLDKDYVHQLIIDNYGVELQKEEVRFPDMENTQTGINILRQYKHWYDLEQKEELEKEKNGL